MKNVSYFDISDFILILFMYFVLGKYYLISHINFNLNENTSVMVSESLYQFKCKLIII